MTEAEFQAAAEAECERLGLLWHHCTDPRRCRGPRGFPDLIALGPRGLVVAELKSADGDTSAEQDRWIYTAWQAGQPIQLMRPQAARALTVLLEGISYQV